jgi:hypothetical protein
MSQSLYPLLSASADNCRDNYSKFLYKLDFVLQMYYNSYICCSASNSI